MIDERSVERALGQLESSGMIELADVEPDLEYLFRHALIQEAAYDSLLRQDRRHLHRAVAECMERLYPNRLDELAAVLAFHFETAADSARAVDYLVRAGRFALARFANHEAHSAFERAGNLLDPLASDPETRRLRIEIELGATEAGLTFVPGNEQLAVLDRSRAEAEALGDDGLLARVYLLIAEIRTMLDEQYGSSPGLREAIDRGLELAERAGGGVRRAHPLALLGEAKYGAAEYEPAAAMLEEAVAMLEASGRLDLASLFGGTLALAHGRLGRFPQALRSIEHATDLARQSGDPTAILDADLARAGLEAMRGNAELAIDYAARAAARADEVDNKACALVARSVIGEQWLLLGQPEQAITVLEESAGLAEYCNVAPLRLEYTRALLDTARSRCAGEVTAPARLDRVLDLARGSGDRFGEAEVLRQRARERVRCEGPGDSALADFESAERIYGDLGALADLVQTLDEHAAVLESAGRLEASGRLSARARALGASLVDHVDLAT